MGITAHLGLFTHAKLRRGETIFVHGGSGGVGSCVVQMAKAVGARVITTAGSDEKAEVCRHLGADAVIHYKTQNEAAAIHEFAPEGVNVWWESLREPNFEQAVALLSMRGRIVLMAGRDAKPHFPVGPFYTRDGAVHGFAMFNASAEEQRAAADEINRWLAEGKLHDAGQPRHAARRYGRGPSTPGAEHAGSIGRAGRQDRVGAVRTLCCPGVDGVV